MLTARKKGDDGHFRQAIDLGGWVVGWVWRGFGGFEGFEGRGFGRVGPLGGVRFGVLGEGDGAIDGVWIVFFLCLRRVMISWVC